MVVARDCIDASISGHSLGQQPIDNEAFGLDLKINGGYQQYSAELLRLSLLAISGISFVWLKIIIGTDNAVVHPDILAVGLAISFTLLAGAAGCALFHRYTSADGLTCQLMILRLDQRNLPRHGDRRSDRDKAEEQRVERKRQFKRSDLLLKWSMLLLVTGVFAFGAALVGSKKW